MRRCIERRPGVCFDEIDRIDGLQTATAPVRFIDDKAGKLVPFEHALRLGRHHSAGVSKRDAAVPEKAPDVPLPPPIF